MILYPAIDLKDGRCVRLVRGDMDQATVFSDDPAGQAEAFREAGASWLHIVDLDGAFAGKPVNAAAVEAIVNAVDIPVQLGGGIRTLETVESWLDCGVMRVILGTVAVKDPDLVVAASRKWPGRIAVGIDARGGRVAVEGWAEETEIEAIALAQRFADAGVAAIIHTDIDRDGVLEGVNVRATAALARAIPVPVIASGGVSSLNDIRALIAEKCIAGAIVGRALYDGRMVLGDALKLC
ncbi:MAG: 1-(5-phosphoribosyl)-5-[(5-phosphoribosylamino)methylideneamino]imidazole-4-carboxamide isomerase [Alphaproteobacteria bacterium]|nr:1-(5-phosphoribosyl)-5-[(5-phosphoribosylamino)methylideneamino]imidazole-4-carboxamide isomerase [Alphaproteobacteria bacterium]